eukprot:310793-Pyramimonas_sp.AAC.2
MSRCDSCSWASRYLRMIASTYLTHRFVLFCASYCHASAVRWSRLKCCASNTVSVSTEPCGIRPGGAPAAPQSTEPCGTPGWRTCSPTILTEPCAARPGGAPAAPRTPAGAGSAPRYNIGHTL